MSKLSDLWHSEHVLFIMDDAGEVQGIDDPIEWSNWLHTHDVRIANDYDEGDPDHQIRVSTVFLPCSTPFGQFFETMVFHYDKDGRDKHTFSDLTRRYVTRDEALAGHQNACKIVAETIRAAAAKASHG